MTNQSWYAVRSVFRADWPENGQPRRRFEERVVLIRATSFDEALMKGGAEAKKYATALPGGEILDHVVALHIHGDELQEGDEVWSCVRELDAADKDFLERVYGGELESFANAHQNAREVE